MTRSLRPASVGLLVLVVLAGCGGYARDEAPAPYPSSSGAPGSGSPGPEAGGPVGNTDGTPPESPVTTAVEQDPGSTTGPDTEGEIVSCGAQRGRSDRLRVTVPPAVREQVASFRVQVLQGPLSRQVVFPAVEPKGAVAGLTYGPTFFLVSLARGGLKATWIGRARATVIIEGRSTTEAVEFRSTETRRFRVTRPNGALCPPEDLFFAAALTPRDRVGVG